MDEQNELMFRVADVVIETSNQSPPHQKPLLPFLEKIVKMYDSEDILTSLNAVQAMIHMADSSFNSDFLLKHEVFQRMLDDVMKNQGEILKKNLQLTLVGKLIGNGSLKLSLPLRNIFLQNIK